MLHTAARKISAQRVITTIRSDESKNLSEYQTDGSLFSMRKIKLKVRYIKRACIRIFYS